jgi:hypothetical protein
MRYPRTPIRIINGQVLAFLWNGQEKQHGYPVYRLGKPKIGHSKNGRLLSYPTRSTHITMGAK